MSPSGTRLHGPKLWLAIGALLCGLGVGLGAFGAHGLKSAVAEWYPDVTQQQSTLANWETGVRYQIIHGLAILMIGILAAVRPGKGLRASGWLMLVGTAIFSGMLYALVLSGVSMLGAIVPIGGVLLLAGWAMLFVYALVAADQSKVAD